MVYRVLTAKDNYQKGQEERERERERERDKKDVSLLPPKNMTINLTFGMKLERRNVGTTMAQSFDGNLQNF